MAALTCRQFRDILDAPELGWKWKAIAEDLWTFVNEKVAVKNWHGFVRRRYAARLCGGAEEGCGMGRWQPVGSG